MYPLNGLTIFQSHDEQGIIEVIDQQDIRSLHFGTSSQQSSMLLSAPDQLHALYAQAMMACLLFLEQPRNVLMIGLGGGLLAKFLLRQFPDCRVKAVEFRSGVVKIARSHFFLPLDRRLKIKIGCGAEHVFQESREQSDVYDLIMVDAFDADGMTPEVGDLNFFDHCHTLLREDGVFAINLWGTDKPLYEQVTWHLNRVFQYRTLNLPVRNRGNVIGFALGKQMQRHDFRDLIRRAQTLEALHHLDFSGYLLDIKRNNPATLRHVFK